MTQHQIHCCKFSCNFLSSLIWTKLLPFPYSVKGQLCLHVLCSFLRGDFFICWITLPADLKNLDFKKRERILPVTIKKLHVFWIHQIDKIITLKLLNVGLKKCPCLLFFVCYHLSRFGNK